MLNNKNNLLIRLQQIGLEPEEAKLYLALLEKSDSHLELARRTGINRTKVYRLIDSLVKRGLVTENHDDAGRHLVANDPSHLEINLKTQESQLAARKAAFTQALPLLHGLFASGGPGATGIEVNTYDGADGFKQMLWNELKTRDELLVFGSGTLQDLVGSQRWAEQHRQKTADAGYTIREILNPEGKPDDFTTNASFLGNYARRTIDPSLLRLSSQLCIYNDTVALYHWQHDKKVGVEIINRSFADMQRDVFEQYWSLAI